MQGDFSDPFNAGQMVGMLVALKYVERNKGIPVEVLDKLLVVAADNLIEYFDRPSEDIHLMVDKLVKEMK